MYSLKLKNFHKLQVRNLGTKVYFYRRSESVDNVLRVQCLITKVSSPHFVPNCMFS